MPTLSCPLCAGAIANTAQSAGRVIACPHCHQPIQMPALASPEVPTETTSIIQVAPVVGKKRSVKADPKLRQSALIVGISGCASIGLSLILLIYLRYQFRTIGFDVLSQAGALTMVAIAACPILFIVGLILSILAMLKRHGAPFAYFGVILAIIEVVVFLN